MARLKLSQPTLPQLTVPMHESKEAFRIRLEDEGIDDTRVTGLLRGIGEIDNIMNRVNEIRELVMKDRTLNEHGKKAEFLKYVRKASKVASEQILNVTQAVDQHTQELSDLINAPIREEASSRDAQEIRNWFNQNVPDQADKIQWIKSRVDEGDWETASALLGKKSFLSGLKEDNKEPLIDYYRKKRFAQAYKNREALEKIGKAMLHKTAILEKFEKSLSDKSTLADIEAQQARRDAISRSS